MNKYLSIFLLLTTLFLASCNTEKTETANAANVYNLIPYPASLVAKKGSFEINKNTKIVADGNAQNVANLLISKIKTVTDFDLAFAQNGTQNAIIFELDESIKHEEGYTLSVNSERILAKAKTEKGLFYAFQTLRQLFIQDFESPKVIKNVAWAIPAVEITDEPRFAYRGTHLDVARHFYDVATVKEFIDVLAYHKMNYFHWHLTDDQGWRIEIKKYPKLTTEVSGQAKVSSQRNGTLIGHYNDTPQQFDGKKYGGFYTQEQIKEVVAYAAANFITVVPEIEMPGHAQAVLAAYPEFSCEPEKTFEVWQLWGVSDNVFCPNEATFAFLEGVIDEVAALFPGKYIHIGGDECPKTKWQESAFCQALIKEKKLKDEHGLQSYFIQRMEKYVNSKGKQIIGWDEILEGGLAPNATVMSWRGIEGGIEAAKQKHEVIMTPTSHCYLDYYQNTHADEPLAIGGFLPLEKVYNYEPVPKELTAEEAKYIIGTQGNIWTEYITTKEKLHYMAFPRLCAVSETAWSMKNVKNFDTFIPRIAVHIERLKMMGINAANHLYEIGTDIQSKNGNVTVALSTLAKAKIYYSTDGNEPTEKSTLFEQKINVTTSCTLKAQAFSNGQKVGRGWSQNFSFNKATGKKTTFVNPPNPKYSGSGESSLTNGIFGNNDRYGDAEWLGFEGENCEVIIDLGEKTNITSFAFRNFDGEGQWIYLPKSITLYMSSDGENFTEIYKQKVKKTNEKVVTTKFDLKDKQTQYLKIIFENYGIIPDGNQGAGNSAWLFVDEIVVN